MWCSHAQVSWSPGATSGTKSRVSQVQSSATPNGSFRKLGVPYFGVLIIRILLFRVLYSQILSYTTLKPDEASYPHVDTAAPPASKRQAESCGFHGLRVLCIGSYGEDFCQDFMRFTAELDKNSVCGRVLALVDVFPLLGVISFP